METEKYSLKGDGILIHIIVFLWMAYSHEISAQASWVHLNTANKLVYKTDAFGNRVMDYSSAGYMGGGVSLPFVPVKITVKAGSGNQTKAIQDAIDKVSALPLVNTS